jgi:hypothetical protein
MKLALVRYGWVLWQSSSGLAVKKCMSQYFTIMDLQAGRRQGSFRFPQYVNIHFTQWFPGRHL